MIDFFKQRTAVYCPICATTLYLKMDEDGSPIFTESNFYGVCSRCNTKYIQVPEPLYQFHAYMDDLMKAAYFDNKYIFDNYIKNNPDYKREVHIERLKERIANNREKGYPDNDGINELREFCGAECEHPEVNPSKRPAPASSSSTVSCPRCGSISVTTQKKGFGVGKAAAGVLTVGLVGALAGGIGANKAVNVCQNCGHKWEPGK